MAGHFEGRERAWSRPTMSASWRLVVGVFVIAVGCSSDSDDSSFERPTIEIPAAIECGTQYRPVDSDQSEWEMPTLRVEPTDNHLDPPASLEFENMTLEVSYVSGEPRSIPSVSVQVLTGSDGDGTHTLYQLGDSMPQEVSWAGGHGFTGLQYVDFEGASLQVWCEAA